jgi:hypothetical protein
MIDPNWFSPTADAIRTVIDCLPADVQQKVFDRLQLLARVQADRGELQASYFTRAVSGEPLPEPKPKPRLKVVE